MRPFEILLVLASLAALGLLARRSTRASWLGSAAIGVTVLAAHLFGEGARPQLALIYAFVGLLTITACAKALGVVLTLRRVIRGMLLGASAVALLTTAFLASALPVFSLPTPTGPFAVGVQYLDLVDPDRTDPFLSGSSQKREVLVKLYYPAVDDPAGPRAPYFGSPQMVRLFSAFLGLPDFAFDQLNLVQTHARTDLAVADTEPRYPLLVFSHGAGMSLETQTAQSEDLASHGYVVAVIDHTFASAGTVFPDRLVSAREATTDFATPEPAGMITQIMADDVAFVLDRLTALDAGVEASRFQGRLDLDRVGAIGHSVGGAVAYALAVRDPRIKAAIDLDGVVYVAPSGDVDDVAPFLMLANDRGHVQAIAGRLPLMPAFEALNDADRRFTLDVYGGSDAYAAAYAEARRNVVALTEVLERSDTLYTISGCDHMKFIDVGLFIGLAPLREAIGIGGGTEPARCLQITSAVSLAFFDAHLKGGRPTALEALLERYPELQRIRLN